MAWWNYNVTHGYTSQYQGPGTDTPHFAIDIGTPFHTPITALESGTVKVADFPYWSGRAGGGEVFIQPDQGGPQEYVYHLDTEEVRAGQHVQAGQLLGLSGGQNQGGSHPTDPMWSSGPHTHVGYFTNYISTPAGSRPYGPDISGLLASLGNSGANSGGTTYLSGLGQGWNVNTNNSNNTSGLCQNWWDWIIHPQDCGQAVGQQAGNSFAQGLAAIFTTDRIYRLLFIAVGVVFIWLALKRFTGSGSTNINLSGLLPQQSQESGENNDDEDFAASRQAADKVAKETTKPAKPAKETKKTAKKKTVEEEETAAA